MDFWILKVIEFCFMLVYNMYRKKLKHVCLVYCVNFIYIVQGTLKKINFALIQPPYNCHETKTYSFSMNYKWLLYFNGHFGERDKEITVPDVSKAWELCSKTHWFIGYLLKEWVSSSKVIFKFSVRKLIPTLEINKIKASPHFNGRKCSGIHQLFTYIEISLP